MHSDLHVTTQCITVASQFGESFKHIIDRDHSIEYFARIIFALEQTLGEVEVKVIRSRQVDGTWILDDNSTERIFIGFSSTDDYLMFTIQKI